MIHDPPVQEVGYTSPVGTQMKTGLGVGDADHTDREGTECEDPELEP